MEDQNYNNEEDILMEDEDLEAAGIKGGSVRGQAGDLDETDMPLNPEDQDMTYTELDEEDYSELNDEEM